MYSGLIPIDYANTSEALFFVFYPKIGEPVDEITIWLNVSLCVKLYAISAGRYSTSTGRPRMQLLGGVSPGERPIHVAARDDATCRKPVFMG